jgi:large subunit ribosomal protein L3
VIEAGPCVVTQIKTSATDGYDALQLGFEEKNKARVNKPLQGHFKNSGDQCFQHSREFFVEHPEEYNLGPMTHGSRNVRRPGSIGCSAWPAKVIKGKKMPGQYGNDRKTIRNLEIVDIRPDDNVILVKGAVPGAASGLMAVNKPKFKQE